MKLGSLRDGRDGRLVVVSRDLLRAIDVPEIAATLQAALDDWDGVSSELEKVYADLCHDVQTGRSFALDPDGLAAPLPRAYQWLDGSAYLNHVELVRRSRGAEVPPSYFTDPLMYQGGSDVLLGPTSDIVAAPEWGTDFEAEVSVITGDVRRGASREECANEIRLVALVNDVSLRNLIPAELEKGLGFVHGKPPTAFSPVAVTPDELGEAWRDGRVHLPLSVWRNGELFGCPDAGVDMAFGFDELVAHAVRTRPLSAGTIVGSGTVSNRDRSKGSCCIAERRALEILRGEEPATPYLDTDERVRIEMSSEGGASIFGSIDQLVVPSTATV